MYESPELDTGASLNISVSGDIQLDQQDNSNKLSSQEEGNNGKHRRTCGNENVISEKDGISGLSEGRIPLESDGANVSVLAVVLCIWKNVMCCKLHNLIFSN